MIEPDAAGRLRLALSDLGMPFADVWMSYLGMGGDLDADAIESFLDGRTALEAGDYDRLVQVANEVFMDRGEDHPVPYAEEMDRTSG